MPNPITTGVAGAHRTHAEVMAVDSQVSSRAQKTTEHKTREALRLAWDMSLNFYAKGVCVKCGVALRALVKHEADCKVGQFERLSREVFTGYVEA